MKYFLLSILILQAAVLGLAQDSNEPACGNGICDSNAGENCQNCVDCACGPGGTCQEYAPGSGNYSCDPEPVCGDGFCDVNNGENSENCEADCPQTVCGDGNCQYDETCSNCSQDCGACPEPPECVCPAGTDYCPSINCKAGQLCVSGDCRTLEASCEQLSALGVGVECCAFGVPTNTNVDPSNCGSCGNSCGGGPVPNPLAVNCVAGECVKNNCDNQYTSELCNSFGFSCCSSGGADIKSLACSNILVDSQNCGTCGNQCASDEVCAAGICSKTDCSSEGIYNCAATAGTQCCSTALGDTCTNMLADPNNCGGCGNQCSSGELCLNGQCSKCGNAVCEGEVGENCSTCSDCACGPGNTCAETQPGSGDYKCQASSLVPGSGPGTGLATTGSALEQSIAGVQYSLTILILGVLAVIAGLQVMQVKTLQTVLKKRKK